ncbi:E3 ubiquitin-protein ligase SINAT3-like isoform X2 [Triticum dicoccoides]|uniref:E3 ubiquitin-protein ligase SINAT3-like isoform X2 n=2 Tax=Triticum dicoccoides TaxID=85692 RepID=UPI001890ED03|nr:E3 ubiquitin-protein ligase SINAT3-like isoform X2 [Triticum dicoccoides]
MDVDSVERLSLPDAAMDADDVGLALHPHGGLLTTAAASLLAAYPKAAAGVGGIVTPQSSVHELLECPVCANSMYPLIHQEFSACSGCQTKIPWLGDVRLSWVALAY